eukprot:GHVU01212915.1.p3 GENE.GHVU01212915.1~~GHVU01212915.1.p3  ORF type:complete len:127 (-),score=20.90 GHVU01212915.1:764-1144(-)
MRQEESKRSRHQDEYARLQKVNTTQKNACKQMSRHLCRGIPSRAMNLCRDLKDIIDSSSAFGIRAAVDVFVWPRMMRDGLSQLSWSVTEDTRLLRSSAKPCVDNFEVFLQEMGDDISKTWEEAQQQ